jgi:hypothetical protein
LIWIAPDHLANAWPPVSGWIAEAINRRENLGDENLLDVLIAIARGRYDLWVEQGKGAVVVQVTQFPRQKVATILYAGGELNSIVEMYQEAKKLARQYGIQVLRTYGRMGWEKALDLKRVSVILQETL